MVPWPSRPIIGQGPYMSKLLDYFDQISQSNPQPMGFGRKLDAPRKPQFLLLANVSTEADAKLVSQSPVDAAILVNIKTKTQASKLSKILKDTPWGVLSTDPKGQDFKGCDFQVFWSELTPVSSMNTEDQASLLKIDPGLEDSILRTIEDMPLDGFLISLSESPDLRLNDLIQIARVRGVTAKWLLIHLKAVPSKEVLEVLRDLGVNALVIDLENKDVDGIKAEHQMLMNLPDVSPQKRHDKKNAIAPNLGISGSFLATPERQPIPDESDDYDDYDE